MLAYCTHDPEAEQKRQKVALERWNAASPSEQDQIVFNAFHQFEPRGCGGPNFSHIRQQLRDPDSFQFIEYFKRPSATGSIREITGGVKYRARNGFGGYVVGEYTCRYRWNISTQSYR